MFCKNLTNGSIIAMFESDFERKQQIGQHRMGLGNDQ